MISQCFDLTQGHIRAEQWKDFPSLFPTFRTVNPALARLHRPNRFAFSSAANVPNKNVPFVFLLLHNTSHCIVST